MRPLNRREQAAHTRLEASVREAIVALDGAADGHEDLEVALARLHDWMAENEGRWVGDDSTWKPSIESPGWKSA